MIINKIVFSVYPAYFLLFQLYQILIANQLRMYKKTTRNRQNTCEVFSSTITFSDKNAQASSTFQQSYVDNHNIESNTEHHNSSFLSQDRSQKLGYSQALISPRFGMNEALQQEKSNFKAIEIILKNQNLNLKQQNQFLLKQVHRLKATNHKYKDQLRLKNLESHSIKQQCLVQKKRADELKDLVMKKLMILEQKISEKNVSFDESQCSLLDILNQVQEK